MYIMFRNALCVHSVTTSHKCPHCMLLPSAMCSRVILLTGSVETVFAYLWLYTEPLPRRQRTLHSQPWEPQISQDTHYINSWLSSWLQINLAEQLSVSRPFFMEFLLWLESPIGPKPLYLWDFEIILRHTTFGRNSLDFTRYRHPCPRQDSNPQSQQASGRRHTP